MSRSVLQRLFLWLYILLLLFPLPQLLNRVSDASQAILGRYSVTYASLLLIYIIWAGFWVGRALTLEEAFGFLRGAYQWFFSAEWRAILMMLAALMYHLAWVLLLGIWQVDYGILQSAMLAFALCPLAVMLALPDASWRDMLPNLVLVIVSLFIALIPVEWGLRVLFPTGFTASTMAIRYGTTSPWRQYVGWAHPANNAFYYASPGEFVTLYESNAQGLRDYDYPYDKPQDTYRILILGDSVTQAIEVPLDATYQQVMERQLNDRLPYPVEVISGAMGGWSNDQHLLFLRHEGCRYDPDLVLLQLTVNDPAGNTLTNKPYFTLEDDELVLHNFPYALPESLQQTQQHPFNPILERSHITRILWQEALRFARNYTHANQGGLQPAITDDVNVREDIEITDWQDWIPLTDALIAQIKAEAAQCDADFAAFVEPTIELIAPQSIGVEAQDRAVQNGVMLALYDSLARHDIRHPSYETVIEPLKNHLQTDEDYWDLTFRIAGHYTELGYGMIGDMLADWVIAAGIVPDTYPTDNN